MGIVSSNISGAPFNGGTITQPLTIAQASGATAAAFTYTHADLPGASVIIKDDSGFLLERIRAGGSNRSRLVVDSASDSGEVILDNAFIYCQPRDDASVGDTYLEVTKTGGTDVLVTTAGGSIGFFNHTPAAQQTGVAVTAAAIHAALVAFGLITA